MIQKQTHLFGSIESSGLKVLILHMGKVSTWINRMLNEPISHILIIISLGLLIYSNTFHVPFQFDDKFCITANPAIKDFHYFKEPSLVDAVAHDMVKNAFPTRIVGFFSFALNYKINGLDLAGYHIFNLLVHLINSLLVYLLIFLTLRLPLFALPRNIDTWLSYKAFVPFMAALLFVSHPVQTGAVTYIVQRFASLVTLFYLLSIILYIKTRLAVSVTRQFLWYALSVISAVLAMKTKENSFTLPFIIVLYEVLFLKGKFRKRLCYLFPMLMTVLIIPLTIFSSGISLNHLTGDIDAKLRTMAYTDMSRWAYLFTQFRVIMTYLRLFILPVNQNFDYDYPAFRSFLEPDVFLSFLFLFTLLLLGTYFLHRSYGKGTGQAPFLRVAAFGIFWFFITLSLESSIIPNLELFFEHRMYLPSVGIFIALANASPLISGVLKKSSFPIEKILIPAFSLMLILFAFATYTRNFVWNDEVGLWEDVVKKSPNKARPHNHLGYLYTGQGRLDEAVMEFNAALAINPDYGDAHYNLGNAYLNQARMEEAVKEYQAALQRNPSYVYAYYNLGLYYFSKNLLDEAMREFQAAQKLNPSSPYIHRSIGIIYARQNHLDRSITEFQAAVKLSPDYAEAYNDLGTSYFKQGAIAEAVKEFKTALIIRPDYALAKANLDRALEDLKLGR